MANSVYHLNRAINQPIEFKGLKAQYILYLSLGAMVLLIVFILFYFAGLPSLINVGLTAGLAVGWVSLIFGISKRFGEHGLMKFFAGRRLPLCILLNNRSIFLFN